MRAVDEFAHEVGAKWPKVVARIVDDIEPLLAFYRWRAVNGPHLVALDDHLFSKRAPARTSEREQQDQEACFVTR